MAPRMASRIRTNMLIYLAMKFPALFQNVRRLDISLPDHAPGWWAYAEATDGITSAELGTLQKWTRDLVAKMKINKKEGERMKWTGIIPKFGGQWGVLAFKWDREVEDVLQKLELTVTHMWYKASADEYDDAGMPPYTLWQTHYGIIFDELFPDSDLKTGSGNFNTALTDWFGHWLIEHIHNTRKVKNRNQALDLGALDIRTLISLSAQLGKWTSALQWTLTKEDEDFMKDIGDITDEATDEEMKAYWRRLSDTAKKIQWAGWTYGQVEVLINITRKEPREIDLNAVSNNALKAAIKNGRRLGSLRVKTLTTLKIREATPEQIDEFDQNLAANLQTWLGTDVDISASLLQNLLNSEDDDPDVEKWRQEMFMSGEDLGVEEEKDLTPEQLYKMLGWNPETGLPAAFRRFTPSDPTSAPPPNHPPDQPSRLPANASDADKLLAWRAIKEGWTLFRGVCLADAVGTGKTAQMLALVGTLIQLYDFQESSGKTLPREKWPAALRFHNSFCGLEDRIPNAAHLFLVPASIVPQFVGEVQRFFEDGAVDIFTIGTAAKGWKTDWERFEKSKQKPIRRIAIIGHPTLRNAMNVAGISYNTKNRTVSIPFQGLLDKHGPFNRDWLSIQCDEVHDASTGGKLYGAIQVVFESGLVRVVATATPMYQNIREHTLLETISDYTRLKNKTRKEDVNNLTGLFETGNINEDAMSQSSTQRFANLLTEVFKSHAMGLVIRRTAESKPYDGLPISEDLPPCTQVHVKVTLTPSELDKANAVVTEKEVGEAVKDTDRGNFFLNARKETTFSGASELSMQELEDEIGLDGLVKQDSDMGLEIDPDYMFEKIVEADMNSLDKKILALKFRVYKPISGTSGSATSRAKDLDKFRCSAEIRVLVISNVGASGLNIAFCSSLILYDAGWSKMHSDQIIGRINRRGQKQQTAVYQLAADLTIDMIMLANGRNKGSTLKYFLTSNRTDVAWKFLNNQADETSTYEHYETEYNLTKSQLIELEKMGKFKGFKLPGNGKAEDKGDSELKTKNKSKPPKGKESKKVKEPKKAKGKTVSEEPIDPAVGGKGTTSREKAKKLLNPKLDISANNRAPHTPPASKTGPPMDVGPLDANANRAPHTPPAPQTESSVDVDIVDACANLGTTPPPASPNESSMDVDLDLENPDPDGLEKPTSGAKTTKKKGKKGRDRLNPQFDINTNRARPASPAASDSVNESESDQSATLNNSSGTGSRRRVRDFQDEDTNNDRKKPRLELESGEGGHQAATYNHRRVPGKSVGTVSGAKVSGLGSSRGRR
ncbi:hypothetical protein DFH07DRAFT_784611 [Mycena maculata]|uniref:Helicase C-terminal domain-containing protein n=1 Tax=Mycena maculata TaxID=230809 RepID=A0AAD7MJ14_9AGAR|nr:hypothetical protein DFH07DRAFT_784611 [Mycena maculata]